MARVVFDQVTKLVTKRFGEGSMSTTAARCRAGTTSSGHHRRLRCSRPESDVLGPGTGWARASQSEDPGAPRSSTPRASTDWCSPRRSGRRSSRRPPRPEVPRGGRRTRSVLLGKGPWAIFRVGPRARGRQAATRSFTRNTAGGRRSSGRPPLTLGAAAADAVVNRAWRRGNGCWSARRLTWDPRCAR